MDNREANLAGHPPYCTCTECTRIRLQHHRYTKSFDSRFHSNGTPDKRFTPAKLNKSMDKQRRNNTTKKNRNNTPKWILALLLIFGLLVIGLGISNYINTPTPLYILLCFSFIYSIEKWASSTTKRYKEIGILYKVFLNLLALLLLGYTIWLCIKLFSQQHNYSPLIDSLVLLVEFILFVWVWKITSRNSWRFPSMKLTIFSLICLFVLFAFAGVQPASSYKDSFLAVLSKTFSQNSGSSTVDGNIVPTNIPSVESTIPVPTTPTTPVPKPELPTIVSDLLDNWAGEYKDFYLGIIYDSGIALGGNGCYDDKGNFIILINNKNAQNPTYSELLSFLKSDRTEEFPYQFSLSIGGFYYGSAKDNINLSRIKDIIDNKIQPNPPEVCADFAERLHNNAEKAGIRCGYVLGTMHSFNAFETTDRGLIYIDDTNGLGMSYDCEAFIGIDKKVRLEPLFPEDKFGVASITYIGGDVYYKDTIWDGEW